MDIAWSENNFKSRKMDTQRPASTSLFDVYLRLRPHGHTAERFLDVENPGEGHNTHITIRPPTSDHRKRAVEKFGFTRVFEENATQLDVFNETSLLPLLEGVLAPAGRAGRDGLLATLGVTGSGKVLHLCHGIILFADPT